MWYYEVGVLALDVEGGTIVAGWDVPRDVLLPPPLPGRTPNESGQIGYAWQSDGLLHLQGTTFASEVFDKTIAYT